MLKVNYVPFNSCYAVFFGDHMVEINSRMLFKDKKEIRAFLPEGLKLEGDYIRAK